MRQFSMSQSRNTEHRRQVVPWWSDVPCSFREVAQEAVCCAAPYGARYGTVPVHGMVPALVHGCTGARVQCITGTGTVTGYGYGYVYGYQVLRVRVPVPVRACAAGRVP